MFQKHISESHMVSLAWACCLGLLLMWGRSQDWKRPEVEKGTG